MELSLLERARYGLGDSLGKTYLEIRARTLRHIREAEDVICDECGKHVGWGQYRRGHIYCDECKATYGG